MVETRWEDVAGRRLRIRDGTWELTGDVSIPNSGETVALDARRVDGARDRRGALVFGTAGPDSLNPGADTGRRHHLGRDADEHALVVETAGRRYRYHLDHLDAG